MAKCQFCGKEVTLPFRCKYCGGLFCVHHHLPENHNCPGLKEKKILTASYIYREPIRPIKKRTYKPIPKLLRTQEIRDLAIASLLIFLVYLSFFMFLNITVLVISVIIAFILHELSHKFTAMNMGYIAYFKLSKFGSLLTLLSAIPFLPIKIIAPGYVRVISYGKMPSYRDEGIIAVAGPATNLLMAFLGLVLLKFFHHALIFIKINSDIALLNLLPLPILDGEKIFRWNLVIWALMFVIALILSIRITFLL